MAPASAASTPGLLPCSVLKGDQVTYHRHGEVATEPSVLLFFWGHYWTTAKANAAKSEIKQLFRGLTNSSYARTVSQYCFKDSTGALFNPDTRYDLLQPGWGPFTDPVNPPANPTETDFAHEIQKYCVTCDGTSEVNMVLTPPGVVPAQDAAAGDCGHHASMSLPDPESPAAPPRWYAWADVPWGLIQANPTGKCQPNGQADQGLSVVAVHEWAEAVTDPYGGSSDGGPFIGPAWADTSTNPGSEIGDLCENTGPFMVTLSTGKFMLPPLWSNEAGPGKGECVMKS
jgi:hypothetical protein